MDDSLPTGPLPVIAGTMVFTILVFARFKVEIAIVFSVVVFVILGFIEFIVRAGRKECIQESSTK